MQFLGFLGKLKGLNYICSMIYPNDLTTLLSRGIPNGWIQAVCGIPF